MMFRFFFCAVIGLGLGELEAGAVEKPNVLFLFADDQSFEALGALG